MLVERLPVNTSCTCAAFELKMLNTSANTANVLAPLNRNCFSTRASKMVRLSSPHSGCPDGHSPRCTQLNRKLDESDHRCDIRLFIAASILVNVSSKSGGVCHSFTLAGMGVSAGISKAL